MSLKQVPKQSMSNYCTICIAPRPAWICSVVLGRDGRTLVARFQPARSCRCTPSVLFPLCSACAVSENETMEPLNLRTLHRLPLVDICRRWRWRDPLIFRAAGSERSVLGDCPTDMKPAHSFIRAPNCTIRSDAIVIKPEPCGRQTSITVSATRRGS